MKKLLPLVLAAVLLVLAGCQGRSVAEEDNLIRGFETIAERSLGRWEKTLKGELEVSAMDASDKETFLREIEEARRFIRREKERRP